MLISRWMDGLAVSAPYRICTYCVMDTTAPDIRFDDKGRCNYCLSVAGALVTQPPKDVRERKLRDLVSQLKRDGRRKQYDCAVGLSGGADSSYLVYKTVDLGLRPLVVHCDSGWNSELATNNVENIITELDLDLHTVVVDWDDMRDLQRSYFLARVVNADTPQDHAFSAVLMKAARTENLSTLLTGNDYLGSESILPLSWRGYTAQDWVNIRATHTAMGGRPLRNYPHYSYLESVVVNPVARRIRRIDLFYVLDYKKADATALLERELGWRDPKGKHNESVLTRFLQQYYQPQHLGFYKPRAHLASLVASGQLDRSDALSELETDFYTPGELREDKEHVLRKLNFTEAQWTDVVSRPVRDALDFRNINWLIKGNERSRVALVPLKQFVKKTASRI